MTFKVGSGFHQLTCEFFKPITLEFSQVELEFVSNLLEKLFVRIDQLIVFSISGPKLVATVQAVSISNLS